MISCPVFDIINDTKHQGEGKKFVVSRVRYIELCFKGVFNQKKQTLLLYIESLHYQGYVLYTMYRHLLPFFAFLNNFLTYSPFRHLT